MVRCEDEPSWKPIVDAVRNYYTFLAEDLGAILSDCIIDAPDGGWPSITQSSLAGLGKTDAVIELLRHLPYIEVSKYHNTQITFSSIAINYNEFGKYGVAEGTRSEFMPAGDEEFPPHVVVLTEEEEDYHGSLLLIDTKNGTAIDYQPRGARKAGVPEPGTVAEIWRWSETAPVAELLEAWKQKFRTLEWTVDPFNEEGGILLRYDRATDEVRQIYRDHGWPDDFRRQECREALREWNTTIEERLSQPGHNLHEITRKPPGVDGGQHGSGSGSENDDDDEDDEGQTTHAGTLHGKQVSNQLA